MKSKLVLSLGFCLVLAATGYMGPAYSTGGISTLIDSTPVTNLHVIGTQQTESGYVIVDFDQPVTATSQYGCAVTAAVAMIAPTLENQVLAMAMMAQATGKSVSGWIVGCASVWGTTYPSLASFTVNQ
jgi:hypothetical protein